ncbi:MAG TPA: M28 family peptidase, partial [Ignavibacteriaceae bacterium]|nr:M28 family peptidase [Ignavibacteriaceae bacterium]
MKRFFTICLFMFVSFSLYPQTIIQNIINNVNQDSMITSLRELSGNIPTIINGTSQRILSRNKYQPGNELAANYIKQKLDSYGLTTSYQSFSATGKNVIGIKLGTEFPNKKYMICAHYDDMPSGTLAPGADDNGSGTIAVIEAARILQNYNFPFTIIFALWDEEEQGLVGSAYYANLLTNADSLLGVVNLDMIAFDSNNDKVCNIHTKNVANSQQIGQKMVELNTTYNIGLSTVIVASQPYSDHASFLNKGIGAILLIEDDFDFHTAYHTTGDTMGYINQPYYMKMSKLAFATLAYYALNFNLSIQHTPIANTNSTNPITTSALVSTSFPIGTGIAAPRLYYRTSTNGNTYTPFNYVTGSLAKSGTYNFTIPAQQLGTAVQYYLAAQDTSSALMVTLPSGGTGVNPPGTTPPSSFYSFLIANQTVAYQDSVNNLLMWTVYNGWNTTTTKFVSPPSSLTDSPLGAYVANTTSYATYAFPISLPSEALAIILEYDVQWEIEDNYDYAQIQVSTDFGSNWTALSGRYTTISSGSFQPPNQPVYDGTQLAWVRESIDMSAYKGKQTMFRFYFRSDNAIQKDGIYIDNVNFIFYESTPVELSEVHTTKTNDGISLNWITASELNNKGFEVERSKDKTNWTSLSFIPGNGTSTSLNYYSFVDKSPLSGKYYYRLKQIDFDGTTKIYPPVEVNMEMIMSYNLEQNYPNPFNPVTNIKYSISKSDKVSLIIYDVLGREVKTLVDEFKEAGTFNV